MKGSGSLRITKPSEAPTGVEPVEGSGSELCFVKQGYAARSILERAIAERDGCWCCFYCGQRSNSLDHVTAKYHGGSNRIDNLVFACNPCNAEKNTTPGWLYVFLRWWAGGWSDQRPQQGPSLFYVAVQAARARRVGPLEQAIRDYAASVKGLAA